MSNYGRKNISEVTIVKALKMVEDGYSYSLVAEEIGCNKSLIGKWVKKSGIKPNTKIKKELRTYDRSQIHTSQDWTKVTNLQELLAQQRNKVIEEVMELIENGDITKFTAPDSDMAKFIGKDKDWFLSQKDLLAKLKNMKD